MQQLLKTTPAPVKIQPRLQVNKPGDRFEQEADAMADKVMQMSGGHQQQAPGAVTGLIGRSVQRKCAHCEEEEKKKVMRKENGAGGAPSVSHIFTHTLGSTRGGGTKMNRGIQHNMENAFQADFSSVRIHRDGTADEMARSVNALAFTYGNDIYFKNGTYSDTSSEGQRLLAHELTHVLQQSGGAATAQVQRDEDSEKKEERSDLSKALDKNDLFQKLPKTARDKILDEIDKAPETITTMVLEEIIDNFAPEEYREGLKEAGKALVQKLFGKNKVTFSVCDAHSGYHEGTSSTYKGQCCIGTVESAQNCCPKDRFAPNETTPCCQPGQVVGGDGKCFTPPAIDPKTICVAPGRKDDTGTCCMPPLQVINGLCQQPPAPQPPTPKPPFSLSFSLGVIDDFDINQSVINSRQKSKFEAIKKQVNEFMITCPASIVYITGHTDKPGTPTANFDLALRRAEHVKFLLQLDLMKIDFNGLGPTIITFSEGENKPVKDTPENVYALENRRVEIEFTSICAPLGTSGTGTPTNKYFGL